MGKQATANSGQDSEVAVMNGNIRVGNLFGIPFYINPSWFLVLGLVTLTYGNALALSFPALPMGLPLLLGLGTSLLVFASVLAHELGHSFVARKQGINVRSITLFLFGGLANLEKESETPGEAFWVAIAGPLVSFFLFGVLTLLAATMPLAAPVAAIVSLLGMVNLSLGLFNLIPGLPLDGGNILKAIVWKVTGNPYRGVKFASWVGQAFGWLAIASGVLPFVLFGTFGNVWNVLIGWFLLQNAGRSAQFARVQEQLSGLVAADAVTVNSPVVAADLSLREFVDVRTLDRDNWRRFLVTNHEGQLVGEINLDTLKTIPTDRWSTTTVSELMQPIEPTRIIAADRPLLDAIEVIEKEKMNTLTVIGDNGVLVGLLEKAAIINLVQNRPQATVV
jgi:Zn-dependent protease/CBS domain-containing protein